MFTGRAFSGEEATRRGLVDYACPREQLDKAVDGLVADIIAGAPLTVRNSKRMIRSLLNHEGRGNALGAELEAELARLALECNTSEDVREGVAAFLERRPPRFLGR
jgi:enoyl-CoA hydratase/carnithine racemase